MRTTSKILVLTPVKDAQSSIDAYFRNLQRLSYPHHLVSLGVLESDSRDGTYASFENRLTALREEFASAGLWKRDFGFRIPDDTPRWAGSIQVERRKTLAKSRNHLLSRALRDEDWVLWLDVDVDDYPADIIERLLATGKDIVHPNCVLEYGGPSYDLNAWRDHKRFHLHDLKTRGDLVELHAVGGTMLMIKADLHRDGLVFPPFLYGRRSKLIRHRNYFFANWREALTGWWRIPQKLRRHEYAGEIETEGLGIMAHDMGHTCWGMPNLEIRHRQEDP